MEENTITIDLSAGDEHLGSRDVVFRYKNGAFQPNECYWADNGEKLSWQVAITLWSLTTTADATGLAG